MRGIENRIVRFSRQALAMLFAVTVAFASVPSVIVNAAQLTSRSVTLSSSAAGGSSVSYTFGVTPAASTTIQSINIDFCDSASGSCNPSTSTGVPTGLSTTGASLSSTSGLGTGGTWTGSFATNGRLRITNSSNTGAPSASTITFGGITNPTTTNTTYYMRITTYSDAAYTTAIDTGTVAASTASQITVSASVDETLTFCTGTSGVTSSSCAGATGTSVNIGTLSTSSTGTGTSQLGAATNAGSGYAITVAGSTLTSGSNTISAMSPAATSTQGSEQFGMNLVANTTPAVGSNPAGSGSGAPATGYDTADTFKFSSGDTIASNAGVDNFRLFTVSYIANIASTTEPGSYQTALTYVCTATF